MNFAMERELINKDAAGSITARVKEYISLSPNNRLPDFPGEPIWDEPLVGFSDGDDPLFRDYKKIIGDFHMTPREAMAVSLKKKAIGYDNPARISVISYFLPATDKTRASMRQEKEICSLRWNRTRWFGQECNLRLQRHLVAWLEDMGYAAVAPEQEPWFEIRQDVPGAPASRWSQRHVAFVAGLGTFSLNDSFITAKGAAGRIGSVVCDLPVTASARNVGDYRENCLFAREGTCGQCIKRCPAGAVTESGHDKAKCTAYLYKIMPQLIKERGVTEKFVGGYVGCGFCQTGVPCEGGIPVSRKKS